MKLPIATIDSFTDKAFSGNPAAVMLLSQSLPDDTMQAIAMEMNLSETAFVLKTSELNIFSLRWFTPTLEIDLCGHATLASAFWMIKSGWVKLGERMTFKTLSGDLHVKAEGGLLEMNFPLIPTFSDVHPFFRSEFMGKKIIHSSQLKKNWIFELEDAEAVETCEPDFPLIGENSEEGIIITAKGKAPFDIYSRFFGPNVGVNEDPVTGFAHCALMDYWYQRSSKMKLKAFQASKRGGQMELEKHDDRVIIKGQAVAVFEGLIEI